MYGKIFKTLFEGSMYGQGAILFAVWSYVIAMMVPDKEVGSQVHLNPKKISDTLGEDESDILQAIDKLCSPDPASTTKDEEGRRLVRLNQFEYRVVNGAKYRAIRDEEERRRQNREAQARKRAKNPPKSKPLNGEMTHEKEQMRIAREEEG